MMELTPRVTQIVEILLGQEQPVSVQYLADCIGVSKRTVQRELEYLGSDLKKLNIRFMSRTGAGVWLEGTKEAREALYGEIKTQDSYDAANREERRKRLILEILKEKGLKKLFTYSSRFKVSEATVSSDLEAIEEWLNGQRLYIVRKPGSGIAIEGSEEDYRKAIRVFIDENINTDLLRDSYGWENSLDKYQVLLKSSIGNILNDDILKRVVRRILSMNDERVLSLTENSYVGLILHIAIAINRILKAEMLERKEGWTQRLKRDGDYELAEKIVEELEEEFDIAIPVMEISYICLHIKGAKHQKISLDSINDVNMEGRKLQQLINQMINAFDSKLAFALKQDEDFIQGLLAHLQPTLIRILHDMKIQNPVLEEIQKEYKEVYQKCAEVSLVLKKWLDKPVPEAETGFLAVHFGAALVRLEDKKEKVRPVAAGVVCASGIGISRLMLSKLEKAFKDRLILNAYGRSEITPYLESRLDFVISSIPVESGEIPVLQVNPLLNEQDMEEIHRLVRRFERLPRKQREENRFTRQMEQINFVAAQIKGLIQHVELLEVEDRISFERLLQVIGEKLSPYEELGKKIREDIQRREQLGTQIFAEFGFGLLHTKTPGVMRPCFAVCKTMSGGVFEDSYFKGISLILVMLLPRDEHVKENSDILGHISSTLIEDYEFLEGLGKGGREEIQERLSDCLKQYFKQYLSRVS